MSLFLKIVGVLIFGSGITIGFVSGDKVSELATMLNVEEGFRYSIALIWWVSGIVSGSLFYALGMILETVQDNNKYLRELLHKSPPGTPGEHTSIEQTAGLRPKNKTIEFSKILKSRLLVYGLASVIVLAAIGFFVFKDFSSPTDVASKFITKVQEGEYETANKYILDSREKYYNKNSLIDLREKYLDGKTNAPSDKLTQTGDTAVQIIQYKEENKEDVSIPVYLIKTFWGWKIVDVE